MKRFFKWFGIALLVLVIGGAVAGYTPDTDMAVMRAKYGSGASQFVGLGSGLTVHVRDEGPRDGPVIVLLHGSNAALQTWDPWAAKLTSKYRVIRFDQAGHGLTGPHPKRDYSLAAFDEVVDAVTRKLGVDTFTLAGNSMGGGIALSYAIAHPERLTGLVLIDAGGAPSAKPKSLPIGFRIAQTPGLRDIMLYITPRSFLEKSLHQSVSVQSIINDPMIDRYWELLRYPGNRQATIDRFTSPRIPIDPAAIRAIKTPTLIIWGEEDKLIPFSAGQWFAANIPGSKLISYKGVGHIPMEEAADRSVGDLIGWMEARPKSL
jgi:pimeloyl-ACP methyl ester carboxylesterase